MGPEGGFFSSFSTSLNLKSQSFVLVLFVEPQIRIAAPGKKGPPGSGPRPDLFSHCHRWTRATLDNGPQATQTCVPRCLFLKFRCRNPELPGAGRYIREKDFPPYVNWNYPPLNQQVHYLSFWLDSNPEPWYIIRSEKWPPGRYIIRLVIFHFRSFTFSHENVWLHYFWSPKPCIRGGGGVMSWRGYFTFFLVGGGALFRGRVLTT